MRRWVVVAVVLAGCGGSDAPQRRGRRRRPRRPRRRRRRRSAPIPGRGRGCEARSRALTWRTRRARRCGCRSTGPAASDETLDLRVAVAGAKDAPVLVILTGGPGEPALPFMDRAREWFGPEAKKLRLVAIDQRGTGADALQCPALQSAMGASDLTPPPAAAVQSCAEAVGDQRALLHHRRHRRGPRRAPACARRAQARARRHLVRHVRRAALRARASGQREPPGARLGGPGGRRQPALGRPDQGGRARPG